MSRAWRENWIREPLPIDDTTRYKAELDFLYTTRRDSRGPEKIYASFELTRYESTSETDEGLGGHA